MIDKKMNDDEEAPAEKGNILNGEAKMFCN